MALLARNVAEVGRESRGEWLGLVREDDERRARQAAKAGFERRAGAPERPGHPPRVEGGDD